MEKEVREEIALAINRCQQKGLFDRDVLGTGTLSRELNSYSRRSREWDLFEVGYAMAELGFEMAVTPITHLRGWRIGANTLNSPIVRKDSEQ